MERIQTLERTSKKKHIQIKKQQKEIESLQNELYASEVRVKAAREEAEAECNQRLEMIEEGHKLDLENKTAKIRKLKGNIAEMNIKING